jgi:single-strand DNA-binding protein
METYITVAGNLVADPELRSVANGQTVASFRLAWNSRRYDREAGEFKDNPPMYIGVSCWRTLGANVHASLRKGDSVLVYGRLQFREFNDRAGNRRSAHEIDAIAVGPDLGKYAANVRRPSRAADPEPATAAA